MDYYDNIEEMPTYNYNKIQETGDLKYIAKSKGDIDEEKAKECWDSVRQQMIDRYGMDFELQDYYETLRRLVLAKAKFLETGERFIKNEIRLLEAQLKAAENQSSVSYERIYLSISKYLGYRFDPKIESIVRYKECLQMMEEESGSRENKNKDL